MRGENQVGRASLLTVGTLVLLGVLGIAPVPAMAAGSGDAGSCHPPALCAAAPSGALPTALSGMWVQIDRSGQMVAPTNPTIPPAISRLLSQNSRGLRVVERKSGRLSMALDGRFLSAVVARVDDSGRVVTSCDADLSPTEGRE
jgi:hypothetical protein